MTEKSRRDRVGLGLIGLGPSWEQVYRETIERLRNRLTIRIVYDPVEARARSVASEFDAEVASSLYQIANRQTLQGLLVLDPGWCGTGALRLIAQSGKPAFLACPILRTTSQLNSILSRLGGDSQSNGHSPKADDHFMPELRMRFTPASCRLRELMATKLGTVNRILIDADRSANAGDLAGLVDWCSSIIGRTLADPNLSSYSENSTEWHFEFDPVNLMDHSVNSHRKTARIRLNRIENSPPRIDIECDRGQAILIDRVRISWRTSLESAEETLIEERTETEILIDQFCRRALGGLNPVGRLSELTRAMEIVDSFRTSLG